MLQKFKNHCKRPITWGAYYKLCGIGFLASTVVGLGYAAAYMIEMKRSAARIEAWNETIYGKNEDEAE